MAFSKYASQKGISVALREILGIFKNHIFVNIIYV